MLVGYNSILDNDDFAEKKKENNPELVCDVLEREKKQSCLA
jgi:hypothetical protein